MLSYLTFNAIINIYVSSISYGEIHQICYDLDQLETNLRKVNLQLEELNKIVVELEVLVEDELKNAQLNLKKAQLENTYRTN